MQPHPTDDIEQNDSNRLTEVSRVAPTSTELELPSEQSVGSRYETLIRLADSGLNIRLKRF